MLIWTLPALSSILIAASALKWGPLLIDNVLALEMFTTSASSSPLCWPWSDSVCEAVKGMVLGEVNQQGCFSNCLYSLRDAEEDAGVDCVQFTLANLQSG